MVVVLKDDNHFETIPTEMVLIENYLKESTMLYSAVLLLTSAGISVF